MNAPIIVPETSGVVDAKRFAQHIYASLSMSTDKRRSSFNNRQRARREGLGGAEAIGPARRETYSKAKAAIRNYVEHGITLIQRTSTRCRIPRSQSTMAKGKWSTTLETPREKVMGITSANQTEGGDGNVTVCYRVALVHAQGLDDDPQ